MINKDGFYYGRNCEDADSIIINRKILHPPHGLIYGEAGCGKTFMVQSEILNVLTTTDDDVLVLGYKDHYENISKILKDDKRKCFSICGFEDFDSSMIEQKITVNMDKGVRTWIYIDPLENISSTNNDNFQYLCELWRNSRPRGVILTGVACDIYLDGIGSALLPNSGFIAAFRQTKHTIDRMVQEMSASDPDYISFLANCNSYAGVIWTDLKPVMFDATMPNFVKGDIPQ